MRRNFCFYIVIGLILSATGNTYATTIHYESSQLGGNRWQYDYSITNDMLASNIQEFTIFFDYGLYDDLTVASALMDWRPMVTSPALILGVPDNGTYDALASTAGIAPGATMKGFSVSFDWLGTGTPGSQYFEIVNPVSFNTLDSGQTIPEPSTLLLLSLGFSGLISINHLAKKARDMTLKAELPN